jgi:membrane-associated phospholipid phosphatase
MSHTSENSFYSGHVQIVGASTFFAAKAYADYYPDSKYKWVFYGVAALSTCTTGYLRMDAGVHFPSDVLLGMGMGTAIGILVPQFHKHKLIKDRNISFMPYLNTTTGGFVLTYN